VPKARGAQYVINNNLVLVPGFQICIVLEQDGKVRSLHLTSYEEMLVAWRRQSLPDGVYECMEVQFQPGSTITPCFSPALRSPLAPWKWFLRPINSARLWSLLLSAESNRRGVIWSGCAEKKENKSERSVEKGRKEDTKKMGQKCPCLAEGGRRFSGQRLRTSGRL